MASFRQFITYMVVQSRTREGKTDKFPTDCRTGEVRDAHDPAIHYDAATAIATGRPVGFVLTDADPYWFLDIDDALQPDGTWSPVAEQLCQVLAGCAVELSQSGKGLHIFGTGQLPLHGTRNKLHKLELYHTKRFAATTGVNAVGNINFAPNPEALKWIVDTYFPPGATASDDDDGELTDAPRPDWRGPTEDDDLIRRALQSKSVVNRFGGKGATFADVFDADPDVLRDVYHGDESARDAALAQHLAFWTGSHGIRMVGLMRRSKCVREKWDRHSTYLSLTARWACATKVDVCQDKPPQFELEQPAVETPVSTPDAVVEHRQIAVEGNTFLTPPQQSELFKGCVYVTDQHGVLVPGGELLKPDQFRVRYGGYTFGMDLANERSSHNAWEAFTESQALRPIKVASACFKPPLPFGTIVKEDGVERVNVYRPRGIARAKGNVDRYLDVLKLQQPNERDRLIFLSWIAAVVQYPGVKFRWSPVVQGVEGNGKSMHADVLRACIGKAYTHSVDPSKLGGQFNAFMFSRLLMVVEEIMLGKSPTALLNKLKPYITNTFIEIEGKGEAQFSDDVYVNWLFFTNFVDGLPARESERRYAHFLCAQQSKEDLARDGMTPAFWHDFYSWLNGDGYKAIAHYLATFEIPAEFNPAGRCVVAPDTSSRVEALAAGCSEEEQILREAIDSGATGFRGEWISSIKAAKHLADHHHPVRGPALGALIKKLGYQPHPVLAKAGGRTNDPVVIDGGKPRLYCLSGGATAATTANFLPKQVADAYERAQGPVSGGYRGVEPGDAFSQESTPIPPIPPVIKH